MNCVECGAWISVDDHLDYGGLCPYCHEVQESEDQSNKFRRKKE